MQVLFLQDVKNVGRKGDVKQVKDGYFQNFLAPRKLAVLASGSMMKQAEKMRSQGLVKKERLVDEAHDVAKKLGGLTLKLTKKANGDKLYGSVSEKDIVAAILKQGKVELEKSNVKMEPLKTVGEHDVLIHLTEGVEATVKVEIQGGK